MKIKECVEVIDRGESKVPVHQMLSKMCGTPWIIVERH